MLRRLLGNMKLRHKQFLVYTVMLFVMIVALSTAVYQYSNGVLTKATQTASQDLMRQLLINLQAEMQQVEDNVFIHYGLTDYAPSQIDGTNFRSTLKRQQYYETIMWNLLFPYSDINMVMVVDNDGNFYHHNKISSAELSLADTYREADAAGLAAMHGKCRWESYDGELIIMKRTLYDPITTENVGYLTAALRTDNLQTLFQQSDIQQYILFIDGKPAFSSAGNVEVAYPNIVAPEQSISDVPASNLIELDANRYHVAQISNGTWTIVSLVNYDMLRYPSVRLMQIIVLIGIVGLMLALPIANIVFGEISSGLKKLLDSTNLIADGNLSAKVAISGHNEITELADHFNQMVDRIESLMQRISIKEREKTEAEIKQMEFHYHALQAQLNPHFLYNTLESINSLAKLYRQADISEAICTLGRLLRVAINKSLKMVPLESELEFIRDYVSIYRITRKFELVLNICVEPEMLAMKLPKLLLQPIVENSVQHGFDQLKNTGVIEIDGFVQNDDVFLSISDNGKGMETKQLSFEEGSPDDKVHFHVGLASVYKRLKLLYGNDFELSVTSDIGSGTVVTLKLPMNGGSDK